MFGSAVAAWNVIGAEPCGKPISGTKRVFALLAYDPCVRRVYQPAALPERVVHGVRGLLHQPLAPLAVFVVGVALGLGVAALSGR
jgi:hypothetical protein